MTRAAWIGVWVLATSGCMSRHILSVEDGAQQGAGQTTLLTTLEMKNYLLFGVSKRVFWTCGPQGGGLSCEQVCDVKDDEGEVITCPTMVGGAL
jgi:hypothetical protein